MSVLDFLYLARMALTFGWRSAILAIDFVEL
jgi:hypothetical protein